MLSASITSFILLLVILQMEAKSNQKFPQMLEISTRPWLYSLSQKYGRNISKLNQIPNEELVNIAKQNYDVVW